MNRRTFAAAAVAAPLLTGCFWDRHFDLNWEEEVQLQDGRVIVVKLIHTYERLQQGITRYGGRSILRDTTLTFDAGGATGVVTQLFKAGKPLMLDQQNGTWYVAFLWNSRWSPQLLAGQDWGPDQNGLGQHVAVLQSGKFTPASICALDANLLKPNLLYLGDDVDELAKFVGMLVTLPAKANYLVAHPLGPGTVRIERPSPRSPTACKSENQSTQGDRK